MIARGSQLLPYPWFWFVIGALLVALGALAGYHGTDLQSQRASDEQREENRVAEEQRRQNAQIEARLREIGERLQVAKAEAARTPSSDAGRELTSS